MLRLKDLYAGPATSAAPSEAPGEGPRALSLAAPAKGHYVVEARQRLSRSILWKAQRRYFHEQGIAAWRSATVPHYVTSNPALASAYAEVVLGFLRDLRPDEADGQPLYIVELGAGSGRFGFLFLRALLDLQRRSPLRGVRFKYVMTDFTETNLAFWRAHEALAPLVAEGVLDFALFDAEQDASIRLLHGGETITPGSLRSPLVVIANYVFDGISQDAFTFEKGRIHECLVSLHSTKLEPDLSDPDMIGRLAVDYSRRPAPADCYPEPAFNDILQGYARELDGETVLFPCTALRCIQRLADLAGGRLLLLSGDKGGVRVESLRDQDMPSMSVHGSFSLMVNYHAIGEYVRGQGGQVLSMKKRNAHLTVSAFLLGAPPAGSPETRLAFEQSVDRAAPDDFFTLRRGIQRKYEQLDLEHLVSLVHLSRHDPKIFRDGLPVILGKLEALTEPLRLDLIAAAHEVWANYYHIGEEPDLAFLTGVLLYELADHEGALAMFERSLHLYGNDQAARWNMGMCHYALGQPDRAAACLAEAAAIDPQFRDLRPLQMKRELLAEG
ncbi:MAG: tetratricopeptide repeat protein [Minicystis sp.]